MASARAIATRCCWPPDSLPGYASRFPSSPTRRSSSWASSIACFFGTPSTCTGASITFSIAVMCANRLKRWDTMPIRVRCFAIERSLSSISSPFFSRYPIRSPLTSIRPPSIFSRWLTQRMYVVLPEPEGPMMQTVSPLETSSETPFSTSSRPNRFWTSTEWTTSSVTPFLDS